MDAIKYYASIFLATIIVMTTMGFTKAYTSYKLGDIAIKNKGKVSLNPKKHFEIIGFFMFIFFGYGWTAPIDTSPLYYKDRKKGNILVCIVPFIVAFILSFISYIIYSLFQTGILGNIQFLSTFFANLSILFVKFIVFNIIPMYPLFGLRLFQTILPANKALMLSQYERIVQIVVIILLLSGLLQGVLQFFTTSILNFIIILSRFIVGIF
nr:hypothetical protein [uncultured Tyzzerella sp.]